VVQGVVWKDAIINDNSSLKDGSHKLALGAVVTREARASSVIVVADSSTRAVTSSLVTISINRIGTSGTLLQFTAGASESSVAQAADMLVGIPRCRVSPSSLVSQDLLRPASSTVITVVRAHGTLASNTIVTREALASTSLAIASSLVGALHPRVSVVGIDNITNPREILRASAKRAVRTSPLSLTVNASKAFTVVVHLARSMSRAVVLAQTTGAMTLLIPDILRTINTIPVLSSVGRRRGRRIGRRSRPQRDEQDSAQK